MLAYLKSRELGKPQKLINIKLSKRVKLVGCATFSYLTIKELMRGFRDKSELELKRERLAMPVYELSEEEMINPPWVGNYSQWKYRRVKFKGRFNHRFSMYIPNDIHNYKGYDFIVPIITKEDGK